MYVTICERFHQNEGTIVGYGNRIRVKYTAKWSADCGNAFSNRF
nr:DUF6783 domain-containing protein [Blautia faecis]